MSREFRGGGAIVGADCIAVTGAGVVSALGSDRSTFARAIAMGMDAIVGTPPMGRIASCRAPSSDPTAVMALDAARAALVDARLEPSSRLALIFGTSAAGLAVRARFEADRTQLELLAASFIDRQLAFVADGLGHGGPAMTVTTACTASAHAIAHGCLLLWAGLVDAVLAGGADAISEPLIAGFEALGASSAAPCAPFSEPFGMNLGEGACFFVLERAADAGTRALAYVAGYGLSADAHHPTSPDPSGGGLARAMQAALTRAGLAPEAIAHLNAHGTGTEANDSSEMRAIRRVFGEAALPVSSTKSMIGHALGAAAALESLATIEGMRGGFLPPTIHFRRPRSGAPADPVPLPRRAEVPLAMKTSAAFGGANAALIFGRDRPSMTLGSEAVYVVGVGQIGVEDPETLVPRLDLAGLDRPSRMLTAAVARALESSGIQIRRELADRAGLFAAIAHLPWDACREFFGSLHVRGRASATAFSRMVMNGPAGAASRVLSLRGPGAVFAGGCGTTLLALLQATLHLSAGDADVIAVGSAEAFDEDLGLVAPQHPDAGAAIILARERYVVESGRSPLARIGGLSLQGGLTASRVLRAGGSDNADAVVLVDACRSLEADTVIASKTRHLDVAVRLERCDA